MDSDLRNKPSLVIISDTAMRQTADGIAVFEPALREIEQFSALFSRITWLGYNYGENATGNIRTSQIKNLKMVMLPRTGGITLIDKLKIVITLPYYFGRVNREISRHDIVHTRAPSIPAWIAALRSLFDRKRKYWHKFAGAWVRTDHPPTYLLQKKLLLKARGTFVTVNGNWPEQPPHIHAFENPCLTDLELNSANRRAEVKRFDEKLNLLFVGQLNEAKGVSIILDALKGIKDTNWIGEMVFVGDGPNRMNYEAIASNINVPIRFVGFLNRTQIEPFYEKAHLLILPSYSEGFPKVIAEAAAYGCIPVASNVSSISQYVIDNINGCLLKENTSICLRKVLNECVENRIKLKTYSKAAVDLAKQFTYSKYNHRISNEILREK